MTFDVPPDAYHRFMGRFSEPLADQFVELGDLAPGRSALDVGCGPGALTARLVDLLGISAVTALDPSESFVEATRRRFPGIDVRRAAAEELPLADDSVDAALAQLVVHFMADPVAGLREMRRVTRPGGVVAACVWDHADHGGPLSPYWKVVRELDPDADDEADMAGAREGQLAELAAEAGLSDVTSGALQVSVSFPTFEDWWEPYTFGIGPAGQYVLGLDDGRREQLRERCALSLPTAPFEIAASAWTATGRA